MFSYSVHNTMICISMCIAHMFKHAHVVHYYCNHQTVA